MQFPDRPCRTKTRIVILDCQEAQHDYTNIRSRVAHSEECSWPGITHGLPEIHLLPWPLSQGTQSTVGTLVQSWHPKEDRESLDGWFGLTRSNHNLGHISQTPSSSSGQYCCLFQYKITISPKHSRDQDLSPGSAQPPTRFGSVVCVSHCPLGELVPCNSSTG